MKLLIYISVFLCLFLTGCHRVNISVYNGDGKISNTGNYFISYGYKINFAKIDFSKPFNKKFKISNFPKIKKTIVFGISAESEKNNLQNLLPGHLSFKVTNSQGETILNCSSILEKWTFAESYDIERKVNKYFIYSFHDSQSFIEVENQSNVDPMFLTVKYEPKETKLKLDGIISLEAGGYK